MSMRDLIPWGRPQQTPSRYREEGDPFMTLHREMNRLFDDALRGFDMSPFGSLSRMASWPTLEVIETDREVRVSAELPGLDENDVEVLINDGVLTIRGEKKSEVEEDTVKASFKNGVLTVTLPKSARASAQVKRIAINSEDTTKH